MRSMRVAALQRPNPRLHIRLEAARSALIECQHNISAFSTMEASIRSYQHSVDYDAVCTICATVYNGSDYLPRTIGHLSERDDTLILVSEQQDGDLRLDGIGAPLVVTIVS